MSVVQVVPELRNDSDCLSLSEAVTDFCKRCVDSIVMKSSFANDKEIQYNLLSEEKRRSK